jgi:hypothetical protein
MCPEWVGRRASTRHDGTPVEHGDRACNAAIVFIAAGFVQNPGHLFRTSVVLCDIMSTGIERIVGPETTF